MYAWGCLYGCACVYIHTFMYVHVFMHMCLCMCMCSCMCLYLGAFVCMHVHVVHEVMCVSIITRNIKTRTSKIIQTSK